MAPFNNVDDKGSQPASTPKDRRRFTVAGKHAVQAPQQRSPLATGRSRGTVQHTYPDRGFGFIRCTEGSADVVGQDFFFHASGLEGGLRIDDLLPATLVEFEPTKVPRGNRAEHITLVF